MKESLDPFRDEMTVVARKQQINRYRTALRHISDEDIVLDAACGVGYGSAILAEKARRVISMDISTEFLERAKTRYDRPNITYVQADLVDGVPTSKCTVDCVVSLETVEHLSDYQKFLMSVSNSLKCHGTLILSFPHPSNNQPSHNPYHTNISLEEIMRILKNEFNHVEVKGQGVFVGLVLRYLYQHGFKPGLTEHHGILKRTIDSMPLLPELFSTIPPCFVDTSQYIYIVARR